MSDHPEHGRELTATEHFESVRLIAEGLSETTPTATRWSDGVPAPTKRTVGDAAPFAQPGRPPMSEKATDHAILVIVYTWGSLPVGGAISLVLWRLSSITPTQLTIAGLSAAGVFIAIGAAARMIGRAFRDGASALPDHTVNQYTGTVYVQHTELHTETRGFGRTNNQITDGNQ
ncbi:hypothetical protein [Streptomyces sp. DH10]|uniref:hypothetical protein n=1 Tax=Streptomyces sp. DH10 TaxID=3040121 RepID=UPI002441BF30|nr:hypothetical protein [Streptomyces sp. DH10]MDG9709694.1 hypothetical protein [Streptomyces sp. DH10]